MESPVTSQKIEDSLDSNRLRTSPLSAARPDRWAIAFILILAFAVFYPFWLHGQVFLPGDVANFIYPWKKELVSRPDVVYNLEIFDVAVLFYPQDVFYNQQLHQGIFPLWNPHLFLGYPLIASGQSGLLYPARLLLHAFLQPAYAKTLLLMLHLPLCGLGFYLWLRGSKLEPAPAVLGAVAYMFNAQCSTWFEYEHLPLMSAWLGFQLWLIDRAVERSGRARLRCWAGVGILWALQMLAGHLQLALCFSLLVSAYSIYRAGGRKLHLAGWLGAGVIAGLLSAPATLPFLELLHYGQRTPLDISTVGSTVASLPSLLLGLLCPDAFGNPTRHFLLNRCSSNYVFPEFANFVGFIPLLFALFTRARAPQARFWWSVVAVALIIASAQLPYQWLIAILTPLQLLIPGRALILIPPALAYLAAHGLQGFLAAEAGERRKMVWLSAGLLAIWGAWVGFVVSQTWQPADFANWWNQARQTHIVKLPPPDVPVETAHELCLQALSGNPQVYFPFLLGLTVLAVSFVKGPIGSRKAWALVALASLDVAYFHCRFNPTLNPSELTPLSPALASLQAALAGEEKGMWRVERQLAAPYDTGTPYGLNLVGGYESVYPKRVAQVAALCQQAPLNMRFLGFSSFDSPILESLATRYVISAPPPVAPELGQPWQKLYEGSDGMVFQNSRALPRAYWVAHARWASDTAQALSMLSTGADTVVLEGSPDGSQKEEAPTSPGQVRLEAETPNQILLRCKAETSGYLVLSDSYYPDWICRVDGKDQPHYAANGCGRGIWLPAGQHLVSYRYVPRAFYVALAMAGLSLSTLAAWSLRRS